MSGDCERWWPEHELDGLMIVAIRVELLAVMTAAGDFATTTTYLLHVLRGYLGSISRVMRKASICIDTIL